MASRRRTSGRPAATNAAPSVRRGRGGRTVASAPLGEPPPPRPISGRPDPFPPESAASAPLQSDLKGRVRPVPFRHGQDQPQSVPARSAASGDPRRGTKSDGTHARLVDAAGEVFADAGFRDATIREICARAGANVAAAHYHFGDKPGLYRAVMEHAGREVELRYPVRFAPTGDTRADLEGFVRAFVTRVLTSERPAWHWKLMARELIEPTRELDKMVARVIRPTFEFLLRLVGAELGIEPRTQGGRALVRMAAFAIISQPLMHRYCREVVERLDPPEVTGPALVEKRSDAVVSMTMAMMDGLRAGGRGGARC